MDGFGKDGLKGVNGDGMGAALGGVYDGAI